MNANKQAALEELSTKTLQQIQFETAYKWAYRAWAAYTVAKSNVGAAREQWIGDAVEYEHEAVEHAALASLQSLLDEVRLIIDDAKHDV